MYVRLGCFYLLSNYIKYKYNPSFYRIINHMSLMFKIKSPNYKNRQETGYLIWYFLPTKFNFKIRFYNCHRSSYKEGFAILSIFNSMENYNPLFDLERNTIFKLILTLLHRESQKLWSGHLLHLFFPDIWQGRTRLWQKKSHDGTFKGLGLLYQQMASTL